jgi:protein gp37
MSNRSKIEWTDATWNPVSGCTPASPGCDHCYAARLAKRLPASHEAGKPFSEVVQHGDRLEIPLHWRRPRRVFVCSMGDLFHPAVPFKFISCVMDTIEHAPQHTFQVLTKRPERALAWSNHLRDIDDRFEATAFPHNVWLGVTAEDQQRADERIPLLLQCPAAVRFVSVEPMLGPVDLTEVAPVDDFYTDALACPDASRSLDWVICGGESGPGARPMHPEWARGLRDQCMAAGVPFYMKQMARREQIPDDLQIKEWPHA